MFHPCSELPKEPYALKEDERCIEQLNGIYRIMPGTFKGHGFYGNVFSLYERDRPMFGLAVKILPFEHYADKNKGFAELRIACELNRLNSRTSVYQKTYGWLMCNEIPEQWTPKANANVKTIESGQYLLIFMELMDWKFDTIELQFKPSELISMFFLMAHGIYIARYALGFAHGDLHIGNIMLTRIPSEIENETEIRIVGRYYSINLPAGVMPKFIDYGNSGTRKTPDKHAFKRPDIRHLVDLFSQRPEPYAKELFNMELFPKRVLNSKSQTKKDLAYLARFLTRHDMFNIIDIEYIGEKKKKRKTESVKTCFLCPMDAKLQYEGHQKYFCSEFCAEKIKPISNLIL
jgi:hypothetical protein